MYYFYNVNINMQKASQNEPCESTKKESALKNIENVILFVF